MPYGGDNRGNQAPLTETLGHTPVVQVLEKKKGMPGLQCHLLLADDFLGIAMFGLNVRSARVARETGAAPFTAL